MIDDKAHKLTIDSIVNSMDYECKRAQLDAAVQSFNYHSANKDLAEIKKRAAECKCQHEPLNTFSSLTIREAMNAAIRYVVYGRKDL